MDAAMLGYLAATLGTVTAAAGGSLLDAAVQDAYSKLKALLRQRHEISESEVTELVDGEGNPPALAAGKWGQAIGDQDVLAALQSLVLVMERDVRLRDDSTFAVVVSNSVARNILVSKIVGGGVSVDRSSATGDIAITQVKIEKHSG